MTKRRRVLRVLPFTSAFAFGCLDLLASGRTTKSAPRASHDPTRPRASAMVVSGSRRRIAPGTVPRPRPLHGNTLLGRPSSAAFPALCLLFLALHVSSALEAEQADDDCAWRVANALAPVPLEQMTPAMRAGLMEACEGVVAALAAAPAAAGVDQALREWSESVRRLPRDPDSPLASPTPKPVPEPRPRAPGSPLTGLTTPEIVSTRVPALLESADERRNGPAMSSSFDTGETREDEDNEEEKKSAATPSAGAVASLVVAGAGALVVVFAATWPRSRERARVGP